MVTDSLAGLLDSSARATPAAASGPEAITRRHSTEGLPGPKHEIQGNLRPDWTHHLERYKQRAEDKEAHRQEVSEGKAVNINPTLKNLVAAVAPCLAVPQDPLAGGDRKQGIHEE